MKTIHFSRGAAFLSLVALLTLNSGGSALACAACYGDSVAGSKMGDAATWGIIAMTVLMFIMLGAVAGFGYYLAWRAKNPLPDYEELLSETEGQPQPGTPL